MTKALARHERGEARVIPVILRPCRWTRTPLGKLQAVPKDAKPVSEWSSRDAAFDDIAAAIERTVEELAQRQRQAAEKAQKEAEQVRQRPDGGAGPVEAVSADLPGVTVFRDGDDCPEMVVIPAGQFMIGEGTQHKVTIARPFAVGKYPVTFDEWDACVKAGGIKYEPDDQGWGRGNRPVIKVSWEDAQAYVAWLSKKTGKRYRLLSEAEWEYAARAGRTTRYPWGNEPGTNRANFDGSGSQWSGKQTSPVGSFEPNAFGLYDMIGNVWEWVQDCWNDSYKGAPADGSAWESGDCGRKMVRGGSWEGRPEYGHVAIRNWYAPSIRNDYVGFRLARTL
jgi:formylglycine-generating enzyme required for sulfatase activity